MFAFSLGRIESGGSKKVEVSEAKVSGFEDGGETGVLVGDTVLTVTPDEGPCQC